MKILDPCCSIRSFWFDKNNSDVIYGDIRVEKIQWSAGKNRDNKTAEIRPDIQLDYTNLPLPNSLFDIVVFDPPHYERVGLISRLAALYGKLFANWKDNIGRGFSECFRVLKKDGILIFKWSVVQIPTPLILSLTPYQPLIGHTTGSTSRTKWITFVKDK